MLDFLVKLFTLCDAFDGPSQHCFWWRTDGEYAPLTIFIQCNDIFVWACSEAVILTPDNISILEKAIKDIKDIDAESVYEAPYLFCARVNGDRPQNAYYNTINKNLWQLFDDCGPPREVDLGNPVERTA